MCNLNCLLFCQISMLFTWLKMKCQCCLSDFRLNFKFMCLFLSVIWRVELLLRPEHWPSSVPYQLDLHTGNLNLTSNTLGRPPGKHPWTATIHTLYIWSTNIAKTAISIFAVDTAIVAKDSDPTTASRNLQDHLKTIENCFKSGGWKLTETSQGI